MLLWLTRKIDNKPLKCTLRGIDISNDMLTVARSKDTNQILELEQGSMEELHTVQDCSCAADLCNFSIHHLLDLQKVLAKSLRVLRPTAGILYLSFWTHYHELATVKKLLQDFGFVMIHERVHQEEIYPGYAMNAAYTISKKP